ncbi:MAG: hypothetical protein SGARI_001330 [Bacillariaceae sp.]
MKLTSSIPLATIAAFIVVNNGIASAWSPSASASLAMTSSALWKRASNKSEAATVLQSTSSDIETEEAKISDDAAAAVVDSSIASRNTTFSTMTANVKASAASTVNTIMATSKQTANSIMTTSKLILSSSEVQSAAAVFVGTVVTYYLNNFTPLGPVKASSVVGIASALTLPLPLALAAFCGSFAGMAKSAVIPSGGLSLLLGAVCAGMLALFDKQKWLVGVGGRLGFVAQCACTLQFVVSSLILKQPIVTGASGVATLVGSFGDPITVLSKLPAVCLSTVAGAVFMSFWKEAMAEQMKKKNDDVTKVQIYERLSNSVAASGMTGLLAAMLLPASIAGPAFCGSFIAMSAPGKLETYGHLLSNARVTFE